MSVQFLSGAQYFIDKQEEVPTLACADQLAHMNYGVGCGGWKGKGWLFIRLLLELIKGGLFGMEDRGGDVSSWCEFQGNR